MTQESLQLRDEITIDEARKSKTLTHLEIIAKRREEDAQYRDLSPEELEAEMLSDRIENMVWDYEKVASLIPAQLTFHRQDDKDEWAVTSGIDEKDKDKYVQMKRIGSNDEVEVFFFKTGKKPIARHTDNFRPELNETSNSEREIRPGEILFKRIWKPLLDHFEAPYASDKQKYDS